MPSPLKITTRFSDPEPPVPNVYLVEIPYAEVVRMDLDLHRRRSFRPVCRSAATPGHPPVHQRVVRAMGAVPRRGLLFLAATGVVCGIALVAYVVWLVLP